MFARRALPCILAGLILSVSAFADVDTSSMRAGRSILLTPVQVTDVDFSGLSSGTDFRPSPGLPNAIEHVSNSHGVASEVLASLNTWARNVRADRSPTPADIIGISGQAPVTPVPEPATMTLLASGLLGLGVLRRKR